MVQGKFCKVPEEGSIASSMGVGGPPEGEFHGGAMEVDLRDSRNSINKRHETGNSG